MPIPTFWPVALEEPPTLLIVNWLGLVVSIDISYSTSRIFNIQSDPVG